MIIGYRILTYLLIPIGVLFALMTLIFLLTGLSGNFAALLPAFLFGGTLLYLGFSFQFLHKGVLFQQALKPSQWDWILVNGFVALFMGSIFVFQGIYFKDNPELMHELQAQIDRMPAELERKNLPDLAKIVSGVLFFMLVSGAMMVTHVVMTFVLMRKNAGLFGETQIKQD